MKIGRKWYPVVLLGLLMLLSVAFIACNGDDEEATATPEPTATGEPTATPEPTAESTATPEPTAEPTATPEATAEPVGEPPYFGVPPEIPHDLEPFRDDCKLCHQVGTAGVGEVGGTGLTVAHEGRTSDVCRGCHFPAE